MHRCRALAAGLLLTVLAGCGSITGQWLSAQGEVAPQEDVRTCRSLSGDKAAADTRSRGGGSFFAPGARDDQMLDELRFGGEERQRQKLFGECMRKLGYRYRQ
jgi:hypothetical protein